LGEWICTSDPGCEGVARGDVDTVPSGIEKGEWPDAERASTAAARVKRIAEGGSSNSAMACGKWTQCDRWRTWDAVKRSYGTS
jgi:hypothetical protein